MEGALVVLSEDRPKPGAPRDGVLWIGQHVQLKAHRPQHVRSETMCRTLDGGLFRGQLLVQFQVGHCLFPPNHHVTPQDLYQLELYLTPSSPMSASGIGDLLAMQFVDAIVMPPSVFPAVLIG